MREPVLLTSASEWASIPHSVQLTCPHGLALVSPEPNVALIGSNAVESGSLWCHHSSVHRIFQLPTVHSCEG